MGDTYDELTSNQTQPILEHKNISDTEEEMSLWKKFTDPHSKHFRMTILCINVLLTMGSHYCFDAPSVVQDRLRSRLGDISKEKYHVIFATSSWSHMIMGLFIGILIDIFGNRTCCVCLAAIVVIGQSIFCTGVVFENYWTVVIGRFVYSLGSGPIQVVQNCIVARWFHGKEEGFAFGVTLTMGHIGSVMSFAMSSSIANTFGVPAMLWWADFLACLSFGAAILFFFMDLYGENRGVVSATATLFSNKEILNENTDLVGGKKETLRETKKKKIINLKHILQVPFAMWLVYAVVMTFYSVVFTFNSTSSAFFQSPRYGFSSVPAGAIAGIIYDVAFVVGPLMGYLVDKIGHRTVILNLGMALLLPAYTLFLFGAIPPYFGMALLGMSYSVVPPIFWGSVDLLVNPEIVGTAMGLMSFLQMVGVGITQLIVGYIREKYLFDGMLYYFIGLSSFGLLFCFSLFFAAPSLNRKLKVKPDPGNDETMERLSASREGSLNI